MSKEQHPALRDHHKHRAKPQRNSGVPCECRRSSNILRINGPKRFGPLQVPVREPVMGGRADTRRPTVWLRCQTLTPSLRVRGLPIFFVSV